MAASCSSALSKVDQIIGQKSGTYTKVKIKILVILNYRDFLCNYRDYYGPSTKSLLYQAVIYTEMPIICIYGVIWLMMLKGVIMRVKSQCSIPNFWDAPRKTYSYIA
jgi:hypothetical protein